MHADDVLVQLTGVVKDYHSLRPLRIQGLQLRTAETIALLGLDAAMSEVLVNLITGAQLPDSGEVRVFGRSTADVTNVDQWVSHLDRFGLISDRAVMVEQLTVEQNLTMPLSLAVEDIDPAIQQQVRRIASEVALGEDQLALRTAGLGAEGLLRLRLGRALALNPSVLLAEHPSATLSRQQAARFAADFARVARGRRMGAIVTTADATFATAVADRVLTLQPASGLLTPAPRWRRWLPRRNGT